MTHPLFTKHEDTLQKALTAVETRGYWSPFVEMPSPKVYGETANADGEAAFKAHLNTTFELDQPSTGETVGARSLAVRIPARHALSESRSGRIDRRSRRRTA